MTQSILFALIGLLVLFISHVIARHAAANGILPDRPNDRSSHGEVTPRSGGMAIAAAFAIGMLFYVCMAPSVGRIVFPLVFITLLVFVFGLFDDRNSLRPAIKLAAQIAAAALFLSFIGGVEFWPAPMIGQVDFGALGVALTAVWIVGFMNAYNFMDGVNGIAASCGGFALCALAAAAAAMGASATMAGAALLSLSLFGFLPVNFPSGRLFMGDNGSQTVGFLMPALATLGALESDGRLGILFLPTAMAPFLFDVMFTIAHRLARGQNVFSAHREHLYQLLTRFGWSHARVTAMYLSATALSTAGAFFILPLEPALESVPLIALFALFLGPASVVFRSAKDAGFLAKRKMSEAHRVYSGVDVIETPVNPRPAE